MTGTHSIDYSPRNPTPTLKHIDPAEIRLPTLEEYRARRARLYSGKPLVAPKIVSANVNAIVEEVAVIPSDTMSCEELRKRETCQLNNDSPSDNIAPVPDGDIAVLDAIEPQVCAPPPFATRGSLTEAILRRVSMEHGVPVSDIRGDRRFRDIVTARQAAMYALATERPELSYSAIARIFNRDHTTAMHNLQVYAERNGLPAVTRS